MYYKSTDHARHNLIICLLFKICYLRGTGLYLYMIVYRMFDLPIYPIGEYLN